MTAVQTAETPNARRSATRKKNAAAKKAPASSAPKPAKKVAKAKKTAEMERPKGVLWNKAVQKWEVVVFWGSYKTILEAAAAREYALQAKAAYKEQNAN